MCLKIKMKKMFSSNEHQHKLLAKILFKIRKLPYKIYWQFCKIFKYKKVRSIYGVNLTPNFTDQTFRFYLKGTYGHQLYYYLTKYKKEFVFLDIGANQGLFGLVAAKNIHCRKVWAFEPVKKTYLLLESNIRLNGLSNKIIPIRSAISDTNSEKIICVDHAHSGGASLETQYETQIDELIQCINAREIDRLIEIENDECVIVKIDTEGHEPIVLEQLMRTRFWKKITHIYIEIDRKLHEGKDVVELLRSEGFVELFRTSSATKHYDIFMMKHTD